MEKTGCYENIALHFLSGKIDRKGCAQMFDGDIAKLMERHCAECGKIFIVSCPLEYVYKIKEFKKGESSINYYCCYTHWRKAKEKKSVKTKANKDAYYDRLRKSK